MSPAAIYTYVASREELLFAATLAEIDELEGRMRAVIAGDVPADEVLRRMVEAYAGFCRDRPEGFRMLIAGLGQAARAKAPADVVAAYDRRASGCVVLLRDVVERGIEEGVFKPGDPWQTAHAVWGACHGILSVASAQGGDQFVGFEISGLVQRVAELLLTGLTTEAAR